jgi:hypothetical protein
MRSKDILLQAKGDHLGQVHSDQMVLEMIRRGRLVRLSRCSAEAKSLKNKVKGTVWLLLQSDISRGGLTGGQWLGERETLKGYLVKERAGQQL